VQVVELAEEKEEKLEDADGTKDEGTADSAAIDDLTIEKCFGLFSTPEKLLPGDEW
jgi:hypothetical protein